MNEFIFRKYDIRGIVETDFTDDVVLNLGKAFGTFVIRSGGFHSQIGVNCTYFDGFVNVYCMNTQNFRRLRRVILWK